MSEFSKEQGTKSDLEHGLDVLELVVADAHEHVIQRFDLLGIWSDGRTILSAANLGNPRPQAPGLGVKFGFSL